MKKATAMLLTALILLCLPLAASAADGRRIESIKLSVGGMEYASYESLPIVPGVELTVGFALMPLEAGEGIALEIKERDYVPQRMTITQQPKISGGKGTFKLLLEEGAEFSHNLRISSDSGTFLSLVSFQVLEPMTQFAATEESLTLTVGTSQRFPYVILPESREDTPLSFLSSDSAVASVDARGVITPHKAGEAVIAARSEIDDRSIQIMASVKGADTNLAAVEGITLQPRKNDMDRASLSWNAVAGAKGYRIYSRIYENGETSAWSLYADVERTSKLVALAPSFEYWFMDSRQSFRIVPYSAKGEGSFPDKDSALLIYHTTASTSRSDNIITCGVDHQITVRPYSAGFTSEKMAYYIRRGQGAAVMAAHIPGGSYLLDGSSGPVYTTFLSYGLDDGIPALRATHFAYDKSLAISGGQLVESYTSSGSYLGQSLEFTPAPGSTHTLCEGLKNGKYAYATHNDVSHKSFSALRSYAPDTLILTPYAVEGNRARLGRSSVFLLQ